MDATARAALRDTLGEDVALHDPQEVEGAKLEATVTPRDGEGLARTLATLGRLGLSALAVGGGTRLSFGNLPRRAQVRLSTAALTGIDELDEDEGVVHVRAGTPLGGLRDRLAGTGWELPLEASSAAATVGGVLAAGEPGLRHARLGRPRDAVLGLDVVLGDGLRARSGGRVVKNVTGYDLAKLHVGALGCFGVIEAAWLRLRPVPERTCRLASAHASFAAAWEAGRRAAGLPGLRLAAVMNAPHAVAVEPLEAADADYLLLVELAGDAAVVDGSTARLAAAGARPASEGALSRLRALEGDGFAASALRFRIAARPSTLAVAVRVLADADAAFVAHPATGLVHATFPVDRAPDDGRADAAWRTVRRISADVGAAFALAAGPAWARAGRDVFGAAPSALGTLRALKARFDPHGVLAPGRGPGGI